VQADQQACLLVIVVDLAVRNALVDWLLSNHSDITFGSVSLDYYGIDPESLSAAEQVTGRQSKLEFKIQTRLDTARLICQGLREEFQAVHPRYCILPVIEAGYLDIPAFDERLKD
jgi:hypothetical protein